MKKIPSLMFSGIKMLITPLSSSSVILPRLAAMASANNHVVNDTKRTDIALQLFEAYSALSCCCILLL